MTRTTRRITTGITTPTDTTGSFWPGRWNQRLDGRVVLALWERGEPIRSWRKRWTCILLRRRIEPSSAYGSQSGPDNENGQKTWS
jgi:hypothetical protein